MAHIRALHQVLHQRGDEPPIFDDPLAVRILSRPVCPATDLDYDLDDELVRRRRLYIAARARAAVDCVEAATAQGTDQVVLLGAGMDTLPYHDRYPGMHYFEVDHPATQLWKRQRLRESGVAIPDSLTYVPADFDRGTLAHELAAAGFDRTRPTVYIWLGVVVYLDRPAIDDTLRYVVSGPAVLLFDYIAPERQSHVSGEQLLARARSVEKLGERWRTYFTAEEIRTVLASFGYQTVIDQPQSVLLATHGVHTTATDAGPHLVRASTT